jgi:hypothetical protein
MLRLFLIVALVLAVTAEARSEEEEMPHHEEDRYVLEWRWGEKKNFFIYSSSFVVTWMEEPLRSLG